MYGFIKRVIHQDSLHYYDFEYILQNCRIDESFVRGILIVGKNTVYKPGNIIEFPRTQIVDMKTYDELSTLITNHFMDLL